MQKYRKSGSEEKYDVIGVMSGTSVDGLDMAYCRFVPGNGKWNYQILHCRSQVYSDLWRKRLLDIINNSAENLFIADMEFGKYIAGQVNEFIHEYDLKPMLISSHGHTVFHRPEKAVTLQIGNGLMINKLTGLTTISDFRILDVLSGGQGAPLVPVGDRLLFPDYDVCLNLGGFSNISFEKNGSRIACDICPVNIVLNRLTRILGFNFDDRGSLARKGNMLEELLHDLNDLDFYKLPPPKSLGLEWVNESVIPLFEKYDNTYDLLHTFTYHAAYQIDRTIRDLSEDRKRIKVLATGGGVYNDYLMELLRKLKPEPVIYDLPESKIIEFKEALVFALLGVLRYRNEVNTLSSVTGAKSDTIGGIIHDNCSGIA